MMSFLKHLQSFKAYKDRLSFLIFSVVLIFQLVQVSIHASFQNLELDKNSDLIFPISFFRDIDLQINVFDWILPPAPSFFPDLFLFFLSWKIAGGLFYFSFFLYGLIFEICLFFSIWFFLKFSDDKKKYSNRDLFFKIAVFLFLLNEILYFSPNQFALILFPGYHGFTIILSLVLLAILNLKKEYSISILFFLSMLFSFSDGQAIVQSLIPFSVSLLGQFFIEKSERKKIISLFTFLILGLAFGNFILLIFKKIHLFQIPDVPFYSVAKSIIKNGKLGSNISIVWTLASQDLISNLKLPIWRIYAIIFILFLFALPFQFSTHRSFFVLSLSSILLTNLIQFFFGIWGGLRYFWTLATFPFFGILFFLDVRRHSFFIPILLLYFAFSQTIKNSSPYEKFFQNPYPENIKCIDETAEKFKLKNGYSDYWNAKYIMLFSKNTIRLRQLHKNLQVYDWIYNPEWLKGSQSFNFLLTNRLDKDTINQILPKPSLIKTCSDLEIFIYDREIFLK